MKPKFPIYVISKGRWDSILTCRALDRYGVDYYVAVEDEEYLLYQAKIDSDRLLRLPFSNLGQGSIPVRNYIWEHSLANGFSRHWVLDDNIEDFNRLTHNKKPAVRSGAIFRAAEDFVERYENIGLAGFNYYSFAKSTEPVPPFYTNTRIYSCILIDNHLPMRWRGIYNEDTDLSIRVLKMGLCTVLFNAFLCGKVTTMRMSGGNTTTIYRHDGLQKKAQSLVDQHPDICKVVTKFNRPHHHVDYSGFIGNTLRLKADTPKFSGVNNYGMVLKSKRMVHKRDREF